MKTPPGLSTLRLERLFMLRHKRFKARVLNTSLSEEIIMSKKKSSKKAGTKSTSSKKARPTGRDITSRATDAADATSAKDDEKRQFDKVLEVIRKHEKSLRSIQGVDDVRAGYRMQDGWFTANGEPAIIVEVDQKFNANELPQDQRIPTQLDGIPVDVALTPPSKRLAKAVERDMVADDAGGATTSSVQDSGELALPGWDREASDEDDAADEADDGLLPYKPPPGATLDEVKDAMTVICHVSPDAGWPTLKTFIENGKSRLTIGMYDFTAPHILDSLDSNMSQATGELSLILDPNESLGSGTKAEDVHEADMRKRLRNTLRQRFSFLWAAVGNDRVSQAIFPSAYHIKVAVRGGRSFWLSSGNWQSSNQPNLDELGDLSVRKIQRSYNREWHVVIKHAGLASTFEKFLKNDMAQAKPLQLESDAVAAEPIAQPRVEMLVPADAMSELEADIAEPQFFEAEEFKFTSTNKLRVKPLLTPDNYATEVLPIIQSAKQRLYFQNQSLKVGKKTPKRYAELLEALLEKAESGIEVKIIIRDIGDTRGTLEALRYFGFKDMSIIKVQVACHTKGIIVDSKVVVVGSHNWTGQGVLKNRDASLIFYNPKIAKYYERIFLYDWDNLARHKLIAESDAIPIVVAPGEEPPVEADATGMVNVPWDEHEDMS